MPSNKELLNRIGNVMNTEPSERKSNESIPRTEYGQKKKRFKEKGTNVVEMGEILRGINSGESGYALKSYLGKAKGLMSKGVEEGSVMYALNGAEIYAKLNSDGEVPYSVKRRLVNALEKENDRHDLADCYIKQSAKKIEKFIKTHETKKSLERVLTSFIGIVGIAVGIFFLSPNLTGNAIADLSTKTSSVIGAGLFIVGVVGTFIYYKKK